MKGNKQKQVISTQRRLLFNGTSYYLCLPKSWVRQQSLKKGDYIPIVGNAAVLKIIPCQEMP